MIAVNNDQFLHGGIIRILWFSHTLQKIIIPDDNIWALKCLDDFWKCGNTQVNSEARSEELILKLQMKILGKKF